MRVTSKGRYAVMAIIDLAQNQGDRPVPLADIADRQRISLSYLEQMFARLRRGGLVRSVRGPGGGYLLATDPGEIRISDIILAVDEGVRPTKCAPQATGSCRGDPCASHALWDEMGRHLHKFLSGVSVADVLHGRVGGLVPRIAAEQDTAIAAE